MIRGLKKRMIAKDGRVLPIQQVFDLSDRVRRRFLNSQEVLRGEEKMVGIDMTILNEALRFPGTAAGVARVDQAALVVHEAIEITPGAGQTLPEVVGGDFENFTAHCVADSENFAQREDESLLTIEAQQHAGRAGDLGFFNEQRDIHGHAPGIGQIQVGRVVDRGGVGGKSLRSDLAAAAFHVQDVIGRDAIEPGAELAVSLKRAEAGDGLDE
ncbi:MAG TPA: hypothetical protein VL132_13170, partial [Planctomycetaceae bacterium]|nr:hypothetical protein [Planctomycetaceae bacterium]